LIACSTHDPVLLLAVNWSVDNVQLPEVRLKVTAPVPLPPDVVRVSVALKLSGDPAFSVSAAWFPLASVYVFEALRGK